MQTRLSCMYDYHVGGIEREKASFMAAWHKVVLKCIHE